MKKAFLLLATLCLASCASTGDAKKEAGEPDWIKNPASVCSSDELCAVGEGRTPKRAKADARAALGKIFETKLAASFENTLSQDEEGTRERVRDSVAEETDIVLESVEIRETFENAKNVFALAVLNKDKAVKLLRRDMAKLDGDMEEMRSRKTPPSAIRLEKLFAERSGLNRRHVVLTGKDYMESLSYDDVKAYKKAVTGKKIFLTTKGERAFDKAIRNAMLENGYIFVSDPEKAAAQVTATVESDEQYLNVKGFVKYAFRFTLRGPDKTGKQVEQLVESFDETGRNEVQAAANATESLKKYLSEHLVDVKF